MGGGGGDTKSHSRCGEKASHLERYSRYFTRPLFQRLIFQSPYAVPGRWVVIEFYQRPEKRGIRMRKVAPKSSNKFGKTNRNREIRCVTKEEICPEDTREGRFCENGAAQGRDREIRIVTKEEICREDTREGRLCEKGDHPGTRP